MLRGVSGVVMWTRIADHAETGPFLNARSLHCTIIVFTRHRHPTLSVAC